MKSPLLLRLIWLAGGCALLLGWGRDSMLGWQPRPRELPRLDNRSGQPWLATGEFTRDDRIAPGALPDHIRRASSHLGGDEFTGGAETAWFKASRRTIYVGVAGYPNHRGCSLWAEFRDAAGAVTRVYHRLADPREEWAIWEIRRPPEALAVRLVAEDRGSTYAGWVALSHPFRAWPPELPAVFSFLQILTTLCLALTLLWGPGLCWCPAGAPPAVRAAWFLGAGPLVLAAAGVVLWVIGGVVPLALAGTALVAALWAIVGRRAQRQGFAPELPPGLARVLAVMALVVAAVAARSGFSRGPEGELFRGTVSRNFALSDRIDSRFSFYAVQAIAHHWGPASPTTEKFYYPWTFFSRGPLAGLAAAPVVLATGGQPPVEHAEQVWSPYDPTGFAAYRLTQVALAGGVIVAFFLLLLPWLGERWALIASGLLALSPFGVHEILFTWPKWAATAWLATAFGFLGARRPGAAGVALGVGFLYHPLVLLWSPWLALAGAGLAPRRPLDMATHVGRLALGAGALVLPWMACGHLMPHLPDTPFAGQGGFLRYWTLADSQGATWDSWLHTRWMNFANTFVPLHVFASTESFYHFRFSSAYEPSGPLAKTTFLWWNTLPFGLGLGLWVASALALARGLRLLPAATLVLLVGPAHLLVAYWGADPLGLLRECGHPFFLGVIGLTVAVAARSDGWWERALAHPAVPWAQLPETWLMLWLATLGNTHPSTRTQAHLDPLYLCLNALALAAAAWVLLQARRPPGPALAS